jgi:predicted metal-dependent phosphoesterase TrpH
VRADLHCHSTVSDGSCTPTELVRRASEAGVGVMALTDHDTWAGHARARAALAPGQTLIPGMELSCRLSGHSVHLLGYLFAPSDPALSAECEAIRQSRRGRARAIVDRLRELGAPVTWEQVTAIAGGGVVGRPHIARAMAAAGVVATPEEAFGPEWIGPGGRAHVTRYALHPVRAIELIRQAGGVAVLAHPRAGRRGWLIPDDTIAVLAGAGLNGLEICHPDQDREERSRLRDLAHRLDLAATGGSDDHGELTGYRIGCETTAEDDWQRLVSLATGAQPVTG